MSVYRIFTAFIILSLFSPSYSQVSATGDLYRSSVLTPVNSSTVGIEGPASDKDGNLYYVNYSREGTIGLYTTGGESSVFVELPEGSTGNGIRFDSKGNMLIADYTKHNILRVDMKTKRVSVFAHEPGMSQPNDIAIDSKDRIYASDPDWSTGKGKIWLIDTGGKVTLLDTLGTANGIEVSPDEKTLYVNSSGNVFAYDLSQDGYVSNKRVLIGFADSGMDGMRCDIKGNLYVTRFGKGMVVKISPEGVIIKEIPLVGKDPTNIAFGGTDGCTAYVTLQDQGNLESFRTDIPGREWEMQKKVMSK
jgi:sugar lactone lactonase YvrE